jgi:CRP-like cAMP-binding protein
MHPGNLTFQQEKDYYVSEELYTLITQQPFCEGLSDRHLQWLARCAVELEFEAGEWIFEKGGPASRFYLILEGKAVLRSETKHHGIVASQTFGRGEILGWTWLFPQQHMFPPYHFEFSAQAIEPTKTIFFYATQLRERSGEDHAFGYELTNRIASVVTQNLKAIEQRLAQRGSTRAL